MQYCDGDCELGGAGDRLRDPVRYSEVSPGLSRCFLTMITQVNDRECKTEIQTSYATTLETQCSPGYGTKERLK